MMALAADAPPAILECREQSTRTRASIGRDVRSAFSRKKLQRGNFIQADYGGVKPSFWALTPPCFTLRAAGYGGSFFVACLIFHPQFSAALGSRSVRVRARNDSTFDR
jgi:hypothetical protein